VRPDRRENGRVAEKRRYLGGMTSADFDRERVPKQAATNEHWPAPAVARELKPFPSEHHRDVLARIVWKVDGEEWVPAKAIAWTPSDRETPPQYVKVSCGDPRLLVPYVWLKPTDVRPTNPRG
jgi:hypothetical protein